MVEAKNARCLKLEAEITKLHETVAQLRDESDTYKRNYETLASKNQSELAEQNKELMKNYDTVTDDLEKERNDNTDLKTAIKGLRQVVSKYEEELGELHEKEKETASELERLRAELNEINQIKGKAEGENYDLRSQVKRLSKDKNAMTKSLGQNALFSKEIETLRAEK